MMAHLSSASIARYLARSLPPAEVVSLHDHLETCQECRRALRNAMPDEIAAPLLVSRIEPHLTEEEMVAYVAGHLPEARRAECAEHLAACELCRDSVEAMESVRSLPARRSRARWWAAASAIAATFLIAALLHFRPTPVSPPRILASLRDSGNTVALEANGAVEGIEGASAEERDLVRESLKDRTLPRGPEFPAGTTGILLAPGGGSPAPFHLIAPLDTRVVSDRPMFTWQPDPAARAYQVTVTTEALDPAARSPRLTATQWQPETSLPRGVVLLWQVRAWHGGEMVSAPAPPAPPARFEIVPAEVATRLGELLSQPRHSHLLTAIICAREGLRDDAAKEVEALARENPDSPLVRSLRASL